METQLEEYNKILHIEAMTMSDMVREEITPACIAFENELAGTVNAKKAAGVTGGMEAGLLGKVSELTEELYTKSAALDEAVAAVPTDDNEKGSTLLPRCCHLRDGRSPCTSRQAGGSGRQEVLAVPDLLRHSVLRLRT